jgi:hypothetical protein
MTYFLLSVHTPTGEPGAQWTDEQMRDYGARIDALEGEMRDAAALVFSGRLDDPVASSVVRASNGAVSMTDGPFMESKEAIGGFYIIDAPTEDAAREWASKTTVVVGMPIEIRPFRDGRAG